MAKIYSEGDGDLGALDGRTVAILGYGNQGRSQALNLKDSGVAVVVGNRSDRFRDLAVDDGLEPLPLSEATARGDVVMALLPDEVHQEVLPRDVFPSLKEGSAVVFAHGYSVHFGEVDVPDGHDVCLVAPKMLGPAVRTLYLAGRGFPSLVAVHRDASGRAWDVTLAIAQGIGSLRVGAWETTFEEEAITDLFGEQVGGSGAIVGLLRSFETLVKAGYDPDVVELELIGSGELVEVIRTQVRDGLLASLRNHSPTSQFGQLYRAAELWDSPDDGRLQRILDELRNGGFAEVWRREREDGYRTMRDLEERFSSHDFGRAEGRNRDRLRDVLHETLGSQ
ncbi:MAG: ketol-acid reductoisomerase [Actinobacteria bacterium]|nr:ketol-acid reductoisomerase [Actinomycetota bacterium]